MFDVTDCTTITTIHHGLLNTHITQYLKKQRQLGNEIWSVNKVQREKYFSKKIMQKMRKRDQFQTSVFKENALCKVKASGQLPSFKIFQQVQLVHTIKTSFITFQTVDPGICLILGFYKGLELVFPRHFVHNFSRNLFLMSCSIN